MFLLDFYLKFFLILFLDYKVERKKVFNQSITDGEWHEEAKKVEKSEYVAEKSKDVTVFVEFWIKNDCFYLWVVLHSSNFSTCPLEKIYGILKIQISKKITV